MSVNVVLYPEFFLNLMIYILFFSNLPFWSFLVIISNWSNKLTKIKILLYLHFLQSDALYLSSMSAISPKQSDGPRRPTWYKNDNNTNHFKNNIIIIDLATEFFQKQSPHPKIGICQMSLIPECFKNRRRLRMIHYVCIDFKIKRDLQGNHKTVLKLL